MEDNPILEFWNMFMIFLMVIFLILLLAIVIWALGLSLYEFCMAHAYCYKKCYNKCCFCFKRPINTSIVAPINQSVIVPITKCDLIYVGKTSSGHKTFDAEPTAISSIKIVL